MPRAKEKSFSDFFVFRGLWLLLVKNTLIYHIEIGLQALVTALGSRDGGLILAHSTFRIRIRDSDMHIDILI